MSVEITMPKLSDTMEEGTVIRWVVKVGERVSKGDVIAEVETDKAAMEMEAFDEGFVSKILVEEGETVPVGTVIAVLIGGKEKMENAEEETAKEETAEEKAPEENSKTAGGKEKKEPPPEAEEKPRPSPEEKPSSGEPEEKRVAASPAARKLAEEKHIPFSQLEGTGPGGRIVLKDVEKKIAFDKEGGEVSEVREDKEPKPSAAKGDAKSQRIRKVVARKMEESWKNIPHFFVTMAVDISDAIRFHKDIEVSLNDFILAAVARALRDHPKVNALWQEGEAVTQQDINVAFAVATEEGLFSPMIRNCDRLSLKDIHHRSKELQGKIKEGTLRSEDIEGATFTISNMGMFGVESFSAIITSPQAAALAVGGAAPEAVVAENGELEVVQRLRLTLSGDHRIIDGADGAAFLKSVKNYLEAPLKLVVTVE